MKKNRIGYCALASMLLLASCQEDFKDEDQPTISITSPAAGQKVWLETPLSVEASDEQGVSKVAFYLNDELVGEDTEAPYEWMLNTQEYEDGDYVLRTVAHDGTGNQTEVEQEIEVFNNLLKVEVEEGYHKDNNLRQWVIVSNAEGSVLQTEELKNGTTAIFGRPEGFNESFSVTLLSIDERSNDDYWTFATTYTGATPDHWVMPSSTNGEERMVLGTATGSFITPDGNYRVSSPNGTFYSTSNIYYEDGKQTEFSFDTYENPAQLYVAALPYQQAPQYASLKNIQPEGHYELTADDMVPMKVHKTINLPSVNDALMLVRGHYEGDEGYHTASRSYWDELTNQLPVYLPEGVFNDFTYSLDADLGDFSYYRSDNGSMPDSYDIPALAPGIIHSAQFGDFSASVDGQYDYAHASWFDYDEEQSVSLMAWSVLGSSDEELQWTVSDLPKEINELYPFLPARMNEMQFVRLQVVNRDNIASYEEYLATLNKVQDEVVKVHEAVSLKADEHQNSRKRTVELPAHVRHWIGQLEKVHRLQ